jgi:serine/threonine-protein kinase
LGQPKSAQIHYQAARQTLESAVKERPKDYNVRASLGIAYAGLGQRQDAIREGKLGVELLGGRRGPQLSYRTKDMAQIYLMIGDQDRAIDELEHLLSVPGFFSAGYLKVDPTWNAIRNHPRFQALLKKHGAG